MYKYITGIIQSNKHKLIVINGTGNHIHILIRYKPHQLISNLLQDIKGSSSKWINYKRLVYGKFQRQEGYGAFSYSHSHVDQVVKYIKNQESHHKLKSFREEYMEFLERFSVPYDVKYILHDVQ